MGISKLHAVFVLLAVISITACTNEPKHPVTDKLSHEYDQKSQQLLTLELKKLADWINSKREYNDSSHYHIFENILFIDLYNNPKAHFQYSLNLLKSNELNINEKELIIRASQCLPIHKYLKLGSELLKLNDINLLTVYLSPGPEYGYIIDANFQNKEVLKQLDLFSQHLPDLADTIDLISSGSNSKRYKELINFGEHLPIIKCSKID